MNDGPDGAVLLVYDGWREPVAGHELVVLLEHDTAGVPAVLAVQVVTVDQHPRPCSCGFP